MPTLLELTQHTNTERGQFSMKAHVTENKLNLSASLLLTDTVERPPLNGIAFGLRQTDSLNRMIPLTETHFA